MSSTSKPQRQTVERLITEGMGYCCLWAFFRLFRQTALIASRLGVSDRAIRKHKSAFKAGCYRCQNRKGCLFSRLPPVGTKQR